MPLTEGQEAGCGGPCKEGPLWCWVWASSHRPSCPPGPHLHPSPYPPFLLHKHLSQPAACTPDPTCSPQACTSPTQSCPDSSTHPVGAGEEPHPGTSPLSTSPLTRPEMGAARNANLGLSELPVPPARSTALGQSRTGQGAGLRKGSCPVRPEPWTQRQQQGGSTCSFHTRTGQALRGSESGVETRAATQDSLALSKTHGSCHRLQAHSRGHMAAGLPPGPRASRRGEAPPACLTQPGARGHCGNCWLL